jgi:YbaB/EbfC DNA-binding family
VLGPDEDSGDDPDGYPESVALDAAAQDAAALERLAGERIATAAEVQRRVAALVGRAESPDRRVRAGYSAARGLCELHLDPRALRLSAADLAAAILQAVDAARADLAGQVDQAVREVYGDAFDPPDAATGGTGRPRRGY